MDSYFFIPGTRLHKIKDIQKLGVTQIVIDLEDAVKFSERGLILEQLINNAEYKNYYIRVPLYDQNEKLYMSIFKELYENGFKKFVFPKIQNAADFDLILNEGKYIDIKIILLIETTRFFLEVRDVLLKYESIFSGIGMGSHDFMAEVGGIHNLKNLEYVRQHILYLARMIHIQAIDIASMELKDQTLLSSEIKDGFEKGYDGKFFIHPWQVELLKSISLYNELDLEWAMKVRRELNKVENASEFNPIIIDDQVVERPHLIKAKKIMKYYESK